MPLNVIAAQQTLEAEIKKAAEDANNANEEDLADAKIKTELVCNLFFCFEMPR